VVIKDVCVLGNQWWLIFGIGCQDGRVTFFGWCFILLKFVLTSLSVYSLSFFKAPSGTISYIDSLLGVEGVRKLEKHIGLVRTLYARVRNMEVWLLREFNIALLEKWC
jgi:hypothetical protein